MGESHTLSPIQWIIIISFVHPSPVKLTWLHRMIPILHILIWTSVNSSKFRHLLDYRSCFCSWQLWITPNRECGFVNTTSKNWPSRPDVTTDPSEMTIRLITVRLVLCPCFSDMQPLWTATEIPGLHWDSLFLLSIWSSIWGFFPCFCISLSLGSSCGSVQSPEGRGFENSAEL